MFSYDKGLKPACPQLWLRIADNKRGLQFPVFRALIDTGADGTCIPMPVTKSVKGYNYEIGMVKDYNGKRHQEEFVRILNATVEFLDDQLQPVYKLEHHDLRLLIITDEAGLLGRDLLNHDVWEFDGPGLQATVK